MIKFANTNIQKTVVVISGIGLVLAQQATQASPITGSISLFGNVTPFVSTTGTGPVATGYDVAKSLVFGASSVAANPTGSFMGLAGDSVTLFSPLGINPPTLPVPATASLWSVAGFTFTLNTLMEPVDTSNVLVLEGTGIMSDGNSADNTLGSWVATFTSAQAASGVSFSWNSSSAAIMPDAGSSLALFGMGLAALGAFAYRKQIVARA